MIAALGVLPLAEVILTALGVVILGIWGYASWQRRKSHTITPTHAEADPRDRLAQLSSDARRAETLEHLMDEAREVTRLCAQELDARASRVERLIRELDEKLAALSHAEAGRDRPQHEPPRSHPLPMSIAEPHRPAERPSPMVFTAPTDALSERVFQLAEAGHSAIEIARVLQEQPGKIELILALRGTARPPRRPSATGAPPSSAQAGQSAANA